MLTNFSPKKICNTNHKFSLEEKIKHIFYLKLKLNPLLFSPLSFLSFVLLLAFSLSSLSPLSCLYPFPLLFSLSIPLSHYVSEFAFYIWSHHLFTSFMTLTHTRMHGHTHTHTHTHTLSLSLSLSIYLPYSLTCMHSHSLAHTL